MCNTYIAKSRKGSTGWETRVSDELEKLKSAQIRKSDPGVVVLAGEAPVAKSLMPHTMRWGFHRPFNSSINNSRDDKLDSPIWKESFLNRRCLIPVSAYFEWGEVTGGNKQAYEITGPDDNWLWIAGIWEEKPGIGKCYSMITTSAAPSVAFIHARMPAIMPWNNAAEFLGGCSIPFAPFPGPLSVTPCQSPLKRKKTDDDLQQGNLF